MEPADRAGWAGWLVEGLGWGWLLVGLEASLRHWARG